MIASTEREAALHRKEVEVEQAYVERRLQIEYELQDIVLQIEQAELVGELERVGELTEQSFGLEQALRQLQVQAMQAELDRQRERFEHERKELENLQ